MNAPSTEIDAREGTPQAPPLRVVFYGPGRSGKTANLLALARMLPRGESRVRTMTTEGEGDPFEFLACDADELGLDHAARLHLLTVPGRYLAPRARRSLLAGADGVIFVADSRQSRLDADIVLLDELGANLADLGLTPPRVGLVLQYNRSDDREALPVSRLDRELNRHHGPRITAVAPGGVGVIATLRLLLDSLPPRRD